MAKKSKEQVVSSPQGEDKNVTEPLDEAESSVTTGKLDNSIDDIAADLGEQTPEVNQGVIEAENLRSASQAQNQSTPTDTSNGKERADKVKFDPAIHEVDDFGNPVLTPHGRFKKKPGVKGTLGGTRKVNLPGGAQSSVNMGSVPNLNASADNLVAAGTITVLKEQLSKIMIGDDMTLTQVERDAETTALAKALDYSFPAGVPVNPWMGYGFIVTANVASRFNKPQVQTFREKLKIRFAAWWLNRKLKGKKSDATQSSGGGNNERQNHSSNSPSEQSTIS